MAERVVIAIDGLAGSGKSSLAKALAEKLQFIHLNTGMLYRGVGAAALAEQLSLDDEERLAQMLNRKKLSLDISEKGKIFLTQNGAPTEYDLYSPESSVAASLVARFPKVREALLPAQQEAFPGKPIVAEGRDIGTRVFPKANIKFYISVPLEERVRRRLTQYAEYQNMSPGDQTDFKRKIEKEVLERDIRDAPNSEKAPNAVEFVNFPFSLEEAVFKLFVQVQEGLKN